jgi:hypothetical protein
MKCQNLRRKWIKKEEEKILLIYSGIRSLGKRREKGEEKEERKNKSLIRIIIATIIRPKNRRKMHGLAIYQ